LTTAATISARLILDSKPFDDSLKDSGKKAKDFQTKMSKMGASMMRTGGMMTAGLTVPIALGIGALSNAGREIAGIQAGFENFTESAGVNSQKMLERMTDGANGMLSNRDAMLAYNNAAGLVGDSFASTLPDSMELFNKVAAATGQSVGKVTGDFVTGIGRGSKMILDNLGITVDLEKANNDYATSIGKTVENLTDQEKKLALNEQAMSLLQEKYAGMDAINDPVAKMTAAMGNLKDTTGAFVNESLAPFVDQLVILASEWLPKVTAWLNKMSPAQKQILMGFILFVAVLGPAITIIGGLISALSAIVPVVAAIAGAVMPAIGFIGGLLSTVFSALVALVGVIGLPVIALIAAVALLAFLLHKYGAQVWATIKQIWFIVKFYFTKMKKDILKIWVGMGVAISTFWSNLWTNIQNKFLAIKVSIVKKIADMLVSIIRFFMDIEWSTIGKNIVRGIVNGIASLAGWAWSQMTKFARGMSDSFKNFFGIHSPSKLFEDYGKNMTAGLVIGLEPMSDVMLGAEKAVDGSLGASNKNTVINLTLPSGVITKTMMGDILGTNNAEFSENLAMAMTL